jgi:FKBP-type peptidyl-prolyl cis-trans isomerase FklB
MKFHPLSTLAALMLACCWPGQATAQDAAAASEVPPPFKSLVQAQGYAIGIDMVRNFKRQDVAFDLEQLIQGLRDGAAGTKPLLGDADVTRLVRQLEAQVRSKMAASHKAAAQTNLRQAEELLQSNAKRAGVVTLASGLQYRVLQAGMGPKPQDDNSAVVVSYRGQLPDGSVFDQSPAGKPVTFKPQALIAGWRDALKLMPLGSRWELLVPPTLAYGERGLPGVIGPNQALRFELELVELR